MAQAEPPMTPGLPEKIPEVQQAAFLMWQEHCIECSIPHCYDSCRLYVRRADQKCARFVYGIFPNSQFCGAENFGAEIKFRRWARLETRWPAHPMAHSLANLRRTSGFLNGLEATASAIASAVEPLNPKRRVNGALTYYLEKSFGARAECQTGSSEFDGFLVEFYCPDEVDDAFILEITGAGRLLFRERLPISRGWNRHFIEDKLLPHSFGGLGKLCVEGDRELRVVFTWLHLVRFVDSDAALRTLVPHGLSAGSMAKPAEKVKCVVFDLDNTLWEGLIGDDGLEGVNVKPEVVAFIYALDRRGIICAVASKNDFQLAWRKIEAVGLGQHLLFPQIHWGAKSDSVKQIAGLMNVGIDSLAFIDDNPFEREQVSSRWPQVRTFDAAEVWNLIGRPEFDVPITEQSAMRRLSYLAESKRAQALETSGQDIDEFLRSCNMSIRLMPATQHFERCHELVARTNQFNISGTKYSSDAFRVLIASDLCLCWEAEDKFGKYGNVGFVRIVEESDAYLVTDFVMSCRVAEKRVEESLFAWFMRHFGESKPLRIRVVRTDRNGPIREKFESFGLSIISADDRVCIYEITSSADAIDPRVIRVSGEIGGT